MTPREMLLGHLEGLGLDPSAVADLLACFHPRAIRRRTVFLRAGEVDARLGFVASGLFAMETVHEDGRLFIKDFLGEGAFLLGTFEPGRENLVTFRAVRDAQVLEARYADVLVLQEKHPDLGALARRGVERRYQDLCARLERLAGQEAASRYRAFRDDFRSVERDIPLNLVAAYLNITPTQLSRLRRSLDPG
ncbi:MAG TPA: Crp/Fnr family transcriptional regulator [Holophaga sp.]|nr:Crp/Fnr family transcriptional regulator [Holophaga sp.]